MVQERIQSEGEKSGEGGREGEGGRKKGREKER